MLVIERKIEYHLHGQSLSLRQFGNFYGWFANNGQLSKVFDCKVGDVSFHLLIVCLPVSLCSFVRTDQCMFHKCLDEVVPYWRE